MSDRCKQEMDLFCEALSYADPAARGDFLGHACAGRPVLRAHVEKLLAVQAEAERFFAEAERAIGLAVEARSGQ